MHIQEWIIQSHPSKTQVFVGEVFEACLSSILQKYDRCLLVSEQNLQSLYAKNLANHLFCDLFLMPSGEESKTFSSIQMLIEKLANDCLSKGSVLIALGGGALLDAVGFTASIYMRGIDCIYIPTTLLAMVDASLGGKTAIDFLGYKNLVGNLAQPKAVFISEKFLSTLTNNHLLQGRAEIFKLALVKDATLLPILDDHTIDSSVILKAVLGKMDVVSIDSKDEGIRNILNFGHTIAHGLESISQFTLSHGEAVLIGLLVESYLSHILGFLPKEAFECILEKISKLPLSLPQNYSRSKMKEALLYDKKRRRNLRFCLLERIGKAAFFDGTYLKNIEDDEINLILDWMEKFYGHS